MLFNKFKSIAQKYPTRLALNDLTYQQLLDLVESPSGGGILADILRASRLNQPLIVLPLDQKNISLAEDLPDEFCLVLYSSGSSGTIRKPIILTDTMLCANADNAIECNMISHEDVVYTVCSLHHTGGINAQSIPALLVGAHVVTESFNAYNFFRRIAEIGATITHIVPRMMTALSKVKRVSTPTLHTVMCGSDCVEKWHVEFFIESGCDFIINYGLTEAGPIIINHRFQPGDDLSIFNYGVPLGTRSWCRTVIIGPQLCLLGDSVINKSLQTGDCVYMRGEWFIYSGRVTAGCKIIPKNY
jgi:acyl-CoA synthetase (AMP-forming)/AMP-acid ligase II